MPYCLLGVIERERGLVAVSDNGHGWLLLAYQLSGFTPVTGPIQCHRTIAVLQLTTIYILTYLGPSLKVLCLIFNVVYKFETFKATLKLCTPLSFYPRAYQTFLPFYPIFPRSISIPFLSSTTLISIFISSSQPLLSLPLSFSI